MSLRAMLPFRPVEIGRPLVSAHWCLTRDGDAQAVALYRRHYSCQNPAKKLRGGNFSRFGGQGGSIVLLGLDAEALFVWRREVFRLDEQSGVTCAVFRNEGAVRSSELIREAEEIAWRRWPGERLFTFVNPGAIRSVNPGYCFLKAGWRRLPGLTVKRRLIVLEKLPIVPGEDDR